MYARRLLSMALLGLGACGGGGGSDEAAAPAPAVSEVHFTASDFAFEGPDTIESGLVTFTLTNVSETFHHLQLARLDGMTMDEFMANLSELRPNAPIPSWFHPAGGVNPPPPGEPATVTMAVEPGEYAVLCTVDVPDHIPHVAKGMIRPLTVIPAAGPTPPLPEPDMSLSLVDYAFGFSTPPTAGTHTIRVRNDAQQGHEIAIFRLLPGKTMDDVMAWGATFEGPPPIIGAGGVPAMAPGQEVDMEVTFTPGEYVAICFLPDAMDGVPHIVHGMVLPFTIS